MFKVDTKDQVLLLTAKQLAQALVAKSIDPKNSERTQLTVPALAEAMAEQLESQGLLRDTTPRALLALGIGVGYYLNTFFRKNKVTIQEQVNAIQRPHNSDLEQSIS
jgi:hypothetical protein